MNTSSYLILVKNNVLITRILFVFVFLCYACSTHSAKDDQVEVAKPNIILIMADDLGMETLESYGGESYQTPFLNQLAATGMQFNQCYSTPLCTPSRVQIMTGKYNFRNYFAFGMLDSNERTFAHALQDAGYKTCITGKWQLYGNQRQQELAGGRTGTLPLAAGFDTYRLWQVKDRGWRYKSPTLETYSDGLQTFDEAYGPDKFVEFIETFMTENRDQPFLVYFPMCLVHDPFLPSPDNPQFATYRPEQQVNDTTYFKDMMHYMDKTIGRLVNKVDELGLRENTVIIFTGDNGTDRKVISSWNGQRIQGRKGYTVKAGTHVPLIVNWPGTVAPSQNSQLIDFTDFYPTLLDLAGIEPATTKQLDGLSFHAQLMGENLPSRAWVYGHYAPNWGNFPSRTYVHNTEWKLYDDGAIYHIASDPEEQNKLTTDLLAPHQLNWYAEFHEVLNRFAKAKSEN